ncbi:MULTISPECIES: helix-turn-helix transcriptional regulator [unclassified Mesorhizobium]|uniref:helix-turn-helix domain-containing protein n=2 Tax=Mesorhizobium TaxID=68287 RepID=UPI001FE08E38|nr:MULTISPECIES: helix-turn-helix transcriptional regulator [unclassified Mesorhizobium]
MAPRAGAAETDARAAPVRHHDAVTVPLVLGKSLMTGHCRGRPRQHHYLIKLFQTTELPMSQIAKKEPFSELAAIEATPDHSALRTIRETRGYSMEELSLTCGLAVDEIADIENGKNADPSKLRRIASALRLPENALINTAGLTQSAESRPAS